MSGFFSSDTKNQAKDAGKDAREAARSAGQDARNAVEQLAQDIKELPKMSVPAFADIAKSANDLLTKDFYHTQAANLEVKSKAPNGVNYTVKGKSPHDGKLSGSLEGKYGDKSSGIIYSANISSTQKCGPSSSIYQSFSFLPPRRRDDRFEAERRRAQRKGPRQRRRRVHESPDSSPSPSPMPASPATGSATTAAATTTASISDESVDQETAAAATSTTSTLESSGSSQRRKGRIAQLNIDGREEEEGREQVPPRPRPNVQWLIMYRRKPGITGTVTWATANTLDAKIELDDTLAKGVKVETLGSFKPDNQATSTKLNLHFKQPAFHLRAYFDLLQGPTATVDAVIGHEGWMVGGETAYDVQKAAVTKYAAAIGYSHSVHNAAIIAQSNLSVFSASYYNKVSDEVEVGAKATWDSKSSSTVGLEVASKYKLDPTSFAKARIDDRGLAALAYNIKVKPGVTFGIGASFDTQKLNESTHKVGAHFAFEG